jgi:hypothetical protein
MPNTCLTCRWMNQPNEPHTWHSCLFTVLLPACVQADMRRETINRKRPFENCPCWEERKADGSEQNS